MCSKDCFNVLDGFNVRAELSIRHIILVKGARLKQVYLDVEMVLETRLCDEKPSLNAKYANCDKR